MDSLIVTRCAGLDGSAMEVARLVWLRPFAPNEISLPDRGATVQWSRIFPTGMDADAFLKRLGQDRSRMIS